MKSFPKTSKVSLKLHRDFFVGFFACAAENWLKAEATLDVVPDGAGCLPRDESDFKLGPCSNTPRPLCRFKKRN